MMEVGLPEKLFVGGLNLKTDEKALKAEFSKYGRIVKVVLMKDRETTKSRGFAFITFESPEDARAAARDMNGNYLDGKSIRVAQAVKPAFQSSRWGPRAPSRYSHPMFPRRIRGGGGSLWRPPSRGRPNDDGGYMGHFDLQRYRAQMPMTHRLQPVRHWASPRRKRATPWGLARSRGSKMHGNALALWEQGSCSDLPRWEPPPPHHHPYLGWQTPRDSYSSRCYRDSRDFDPSPREYSRHHYGHSSVWRYCPWRGRGHRDGYRGSRDYADHPSRSPYREPFESCGDRYSTAPRQGTPPSYVREDRYEEYWNHLLNAYSRGRSLYAYSRGSSLDSSRGSSLDAYSGASSLDAYSGGRSLDAYSRGRSLDAYNRGRSLEAYSGGRSLDAYSRGRSLEAYNQGRSLEAYSGGRSFDAYGEGRSLEAYGRGRSLNAYNRGRSLEAYSGGRSLDAYGGGRSLEAYGGGRSFDAYGGGRSLDAYGRGCSLEAYSGGRSLDPYGGGRSLEAYGGGRSLDAYSGGRSLDAYRGGRSLQAYGGGRSLDAYTGGRSLEAYGGGRSLDAYTGGRSLEAYGGGRSLDAYTGGRSLDAYGGGRSLDAYGGARSLDAYSGGRDSYSWSVHYGGGDLYKKYQHHSLDAYTGGHNSYSSSYGRSGGGGHSGGGSHYKEYQGRNGRDSYSKIYIQSYRHLRGQDQVGRPGSWLPLPRERGSPPPHDSYSQSGSRVPRGHLASHLEREEGRSRY
ncbi:hypothetical protein P7K49_038948 [Saguinus oedipus]|uniref:RRM domain-containing protein n=1 Tax=Saguinus oedipus TaxID=9490 RepID=A0ABQ9TG50_SAGOE|nr:hypothetical protein P7K49_038948 [Saguinus oedipus]